MELGFLYWKLSTYIHTYIHTYISHSFDNQSHLIIYSTSQRNKNNKHVFFFISTKDKTHRSTITGWRWPTWPWSGPAKPRPISAAAVRGGPWQAWCCACASRGGRRAGKRLENDGKTMENAGKMLGKCWENAGKMIEHARKMLGTWWKMKGPWWNMRV